MHIADRPLILMLAAGRGRRLGDAAGTTPLPKLLLRVGGRSLLERHLERLDAAGAGPLTLVVGYGAEHIVAELARLGRERSVQLIRNPDWHQGSVVSLVAGRAVLEAGRPVVLMDGDVLYGQALLDRLFASRLDAALLLDRMLEPGDEPVKICVDASGRIVDFAKRPDADHAWHGESVGFFRLSAAVAAELAAAAAATVEAGNRMIEYEEPIRSMIRRDGGNRFGFEDISGEPWTEIDFPEDVVRAEALAGRLSELVA